MEFQQWNCHACGDRVLEKDAVWFDRDDLFAVFHITCLEPEDDWFEDVPVQGGLL